jgi:hypothetical protein
MVKVGKKKKRKERRGWEEGKERGRMRVSLVRSAG